MAITAVHASVRSRMLMSRYAYERLLDDWDVIPIRERHFIVGAVLRRGPELHIGVCRRPAGAKRALLAILNDTIARYGHAETTVRADGLGGLLFCSRLGFTITSSTTELFYLRCERCSYEPIPRSLD